MNVAFALEYSLGHATHADNLKRYLCGRTPSPVRATFVDLPFENTPVGMLGRLPGVRSNWSLRASCGAYLGMRAAGRLDAALFHTQVTSLLSAGFMRRVPSVVSLDATPLQYDRIGSHYGHTTSGNSAVESFKKRMNERAFHAAKQLVTWSEWAKASLVRDYGVTAEKITVIPPGINLDHWRQSAPKPEHGRGPMNLLFVGGDFERKGGDTLLRAVTEHLPAGIPVHLHVVTRGEVAVPAGSPVTVYRGLTPNCDTLRRLFADADAFVFPTRADCLPLAVLEAMAMGLPVITTEVGALSEAVGDGDAGLVVPPDDPVALGKAIGLLATAPEARARFGRRAREIAEERFDGAENYARLLSVLTQVAGEKR